MVGTMRYTLLVFFTVAVLMGLGTAQPASALTIIDFEPPFPSGPLTPIMVSGVTFTTLGGGEMTTLEPCPNGTKCLTSFPLLGGAREVFRAVFAVGANFVSVDLGDFFSPDSPPDLDQDKVFLRIFDASSMLISEVTEDQDFNDPFDTLTRTAPFIAFAEFGTFSPPSDDGNSVFADNFTFNPVPEPASLILLGSGLAGLAAWRFRRQQR